MPVSMKRKRVDSISKDPRCVSKRKLAGSGDAEPRYKQLCKMGKDSHVTQSGIAHLMAIVDKEGLPEAFSRPTQYRARKKICAEKTPYGMLVDIVKVDGAVFAIQNPPAMLYKSASASEDFARLLYSPRNRARLI